MTVRSLSLFAFALSTLAGSGVAFSRSQPDAAKPPAEAAPTNIDPAAKALLDESVAAIKNLKSLRYNVKRDTVGMGEQMRIGLNGRVLWIRPTGPGNFYHFKGITDLVIEGETSQTLSIFGTSRVIYIDEATKTVYDEPMSKEAVGFKWVSRLRDLAIPAFLTEATPLEREQRARQISFGEPREIHGELCTVLNLVIEANKFESVLAISNVDKLPRLLERRRIEGPMRIGPTWELWDVSTTPVEPKDLEIPTPEGYTLKKVEAPTPGQAQPAKGASATPAGGLPVGSPVPAFSVSTADGKAFTQDALKGKATVLGFWQPQVTASLDMAKNLQALADATKDQNVQVLGVACREGGDAQGASSFFASNGFNYGSLVSADALADMMIVRGFPSIAVINADGKVAAFFEGTPSLDALRQAVTAASGK